METVKLPASLTAENGAKALLMGEFHETFEIECPECNGDGCVDCDGRGYFVNEIPVTWSTIKDLYEMIVNNYTESQ